MQSKIIKFVAGGGKTTFSIDYLSKHSNGLYLAFTNSVVNEVKSCGFLSKTIDSLFSSFVIPKFIEVIPLINNGVKIKYDPKLIQQSPGISKIHIIPSTGMIQNGGKETSFSLKDNYDQTMKNKRNEKNYLFIKKIFGKNSLLLYDSLRNSLSSYILNQYPNELIELLKQRFDYIIIDEAQDLGGYKEEFAKLLHESDINTIFLGDDNQKIIPQSGNWFEKQKATITQIISKRCPEPICGWIRENLKIQIYGVETLPGEYHTITMDEALSYDNGSRWLLYDGLRGNSIKRIANSWTGPKQTIGKIKGSTLDQDAVIIGKTLGQKHLYTAITRTRGNVYSTIMNIS